MRVLSAIRPTETLVAFYCHDLVSLALLRNYIPRRSYLNIVTITNHHICFRPNFFLLTYFRVHYSCYLRMVKLAISFFFTSNAMVCLIEERLPLPTERFMQYKKDIAVEH